ncbi:hypothetical protein ACLB2K_020201 [Fragaria x ananassa]
MLSTNSNSCPPLSPRQTIFLSTSSKHICNNGRSKLLLPICPSTTSSCKAAKSPSAATTGIKAANSPIAAATSSKAAKSHYQKKAKPPSHSTPPSPPHKPFSPPPPHGHPPPALPPHAGPPPPPLPPSPSPNHPTVIVIVFISFGSVFFLAFLAIALCCFLKKKKKSTIQETEVIHFDEHRKIKEAIVEGPHGPQAVVLSVEDDVHIDEAIRKDETSKKRWPYSSSSNVQETDIILVDGHEKVKEDIVEGPHGSKAVLLTIDDDIHVDEEIRKNERSGKDGHHHLHQAGQ